MEGNKQDNYSPQESPSIALNSSANSSSYTENVDTEFHRKETSVVDSVASVVVENEDLSTGILNTSESIDGAKVVDNAVAFEVEENKEPSARLQNISESMDAAKIVDDALPSVIEASEGPSAELLHISESIDNAKISDDALASAVEENKDPSLGLQNNLEFIGDPKIVDGTGSEHIKANQPETEKSGDKILSNKSENGISVASKDIQKHSYTDNKKISGDGHLFPAKPAGEVKAVKKYRGLVDTTAPFESVKEAVSKFGGIVDWKAHKAQVVERRRLVQLELEKIKEEMPLYKQQSEDAENVKAGILKELDGTKRSIEELKLALEKAQTEESQAKQDLELVQLRAKEIDQGIASEVSVAAKAQVDVVKARYTAATEELKSVKKELNSLQEHHEFLINEKDSAIKKAEEAVNASRDIEKAMEDLTMELIAAREALESAHASHMEAEEHRIGTVLARDQDVLIWEKELKQAEVELQLLNEKLLSVKDLQSKLATASALLHNLKAELAAYMEAKLSEESEDADGGKVTNDNEVTATHASSQLAVASIKRETERVNSSIEKAKEEAKCLTVAAASMKSELETEKAALNNMKQREGMASIAVQSLEAELHRVQKEIEFAQAKEKEAKDELVKLPGALQQASWEADEAKAAAQTAFEELRKAKEEADQVKASASTIQSRLNASLKEIEAARASERIALSAIKALQESEHSATTGLDDLDSGAQVTIPLDEYYKLSKQAYEAEEQANQRVSASLSQIEVAKVSESQAQEKLAEAIHELEEKRVALRLAKEKEEKAMQGKLGAEQELRKWRADHEKRRKAAEASTVGVPPRSPQGSLEEKTETKPEWGKAYVSHAAPSGIGSFSENSRGNVIPEGKARKKKSLFPRFVRFLVRKKPQTLD